jgi:curved DNA-binding protein CbpA
MKPDYYQVLGVRPEATFAQIKAAWRTRARESHPDRKSGDADPRGSSMTLLNEAWEILSSTSRRRAYDLGRRVPEPREIQDAVLAAARSIVATRGWAVSGSPRGDAILTRGEARLMVRYGRILTSTGFEEWLPGVAVLSGRFRIDCAAFLACRVLIPKDHGLNLKAGRVPAVAIDLTESRVFGAFPSRGSEEPFLPFLIE